MALLDKINFDPAADMIYILGDVIDRGPEPLKCLQFVKKTNKIHLIMGNHEQLLLDYYDSRRGSPDGIPCPSAASRWEHNGGGVTFDQLERIPPAALDEMRNYIRHRPYYKTVTVNGERFFLSHAGLDQTLPFSRQPQKALIWSRRDFFRYKTLKRHICIFGHTPTPHLRGDYDNFDVWFDPEHKDKIGIDCGCVYGGKLAALRLDDLAVSYIAPKVRYS